MFNKHPDPMRMEPTPERVLSVCKMVARHPIAKDELIRVMTLGSENPDVGAAITVAMEELHAIEQIDGKLTLAVPADVVATPISFRRFVSSFVFRNSDSTFYRFTKWFISQNERIFSLGKWETLATTARTESTLLEGMGENAVLGWRFWAAFLGIGYLNGTIMLPNMTIRIQDVLVSYFADAFQFEMPIRAQEFLSWLAAEIPEVDFSQDTLPLAFSAGLRTLHELHLINLQTQRDTDRVRLYNAGDDNNAFSHILVRGEICK